MKDVIEKLATVFWGEHYSKDDLKSIKESVLTVINNQNNKDDLSFIQCHNCNVSIDDCKCLKDTKSDKSAEEIEAIIFENSVQETIKNYGSGRFLTLDAVGMVAKEIANQHSTQSITECEHKNITPYFKNVMECQNCDEIIKTW